MRILMVEDDPRYRALMHHHLACHWSDAVIVTHDPATLGALPPEFLAQGYDAVLLDYEWANGRGIDWLGDLAKRPGFAPIVFMSENADDTTAQRALSLGASAVLGKSKLEPRKLIDALNASARKQNEQRHTWRNTTDGAASQLFSGARIPGYRNIKRLASGPVSDLFLAESERVGALVVIKITRDKQPENELDQSFKRFLQEYEIAQRVRHTGIVRLYDLGLTDEHAYLVMEYFAAGDLRKRMRAGMSRRQSLCACLEIARILDSIHLAGTLHRDLKPGNVMLRDDESLALIDFGLAKNEALDMDITDTGMIFGTPHYMSPEQGHGEAIDVRSDLYSLGVILFEMLARKKPYLAENPMAIIYMHRKRPVPQLPDDLQMFQPLIDKLLAKLPDDRFASATAVIDALKEALHRMASPEPITRPAPVT